MALSSIFFFGHLSFFFLGVGNIFYDVLHQDHHVEHNKFLPLINNEIEHGRKERFKQNFIRLRQAVFLTGNLTTTDFDGGIEPWNAGIWG